jgi:outer membrane immunogenic protein
VSGNIKLLLEEKVYKFLLKSGAMVLVLAAASFAQDWKGFYAGGNAGGVKGNSDAFTSTVFSPTGYFAPTSVPAIAAVGHQTLSPRGFTGGGQAGYNVQTGPWVLGVEADFGSMHVKDDFTATGTYPCCAPTTFTITQTVNSDWLLTMRPRVGVANAHVLVYGTGGLALTNLNYKESFVDTFATAQESASTSGLLAGWTGGGGVEFKIGSGTHWSMKGEYLFADFGSGLKTTSTNLTFITTPPPPPPPPPSSSPARTAPTPAVTVASPTNVFTHQADLTTHIFRVGFNYRF